MSQALRTIEAAAKEVGKWAEEIQEGMPISPSAIFTFKKCGLQYWFRYIRKIKIAPRAAWVWGGAGHTTMATAFEVKRTTHESVSEKVLDELFEDTFSSNWKEVDKGQEKEALPKLKNGLLNDGLRLLKVFKKQEPKLNPHPTHIFDDEKDGGLIRHERGCPDLAEPPASSEQQDRLERKIHMETFVSCIKFMQENGYSDWNGLANGQTITLTGCANMMASMLLSRLDAARALADEWEKRKSLDLSGNSSFIAGMKEQAGMCSEQLRTVLGGKG